MTKTDEGTDPPEFSSRLARPVDRERIVRLCERAVGPNDYVVSILSRTIRRGGLFLAFSKPGGELIGMSNFTPVFDGSGWLGMARTDPEWRGLGVAQFLQSSIASYARASGARCLRFFVDSANASSLRAAEKGGFRRVAECAHLSLSDLRELPYSRTTKSSVSTEEVEQVLVDSRHLNSRLAARMKGYLRYGYAFVTTSRANLSVIESRGELFQVDDSSFVLVKTGGEEGEFGLLGGETTKSLRSVLIVARRMKLKSIGGFLPMDLKMIRKAQSLGFKLDEWGSHAILFEKRI